MSARALAIGWTVLLLVLLWWPGGELAPPTGWFAVAVQHGLDKAVHVAFFALHGLLTARALGQAGEPSRSGRVVWRTLVVGAGLGVVSEVGQIWVPGRAASWEDALADGVGVVMGALVALFWPSRRVVNPAAR